MLPTENKFSDFENLICNIEKKYETKDKLSSLALSKIFKEFSSFILENIEDLSSHLFTYYCSNHSSAVETLCKAIQSQTSDEQRDQGVSKKWIQTAKVILLLKKPEELCEKIKELPLLDAELRFQIGINLSKLEPYLLCKHINALGLEEKQRFILAKVIFEIIGGGIRKYINNFQLCEENSFIIAKMAMKKNPGATAQDIDKFQLPEPLRFEIAKIALEESKVNFIYSDYFKLAPHNLKELYRLASKEGFSSPKISAIITDEQERFAIAKTVASLDTRILASHIKEYHLTPEHLQEVFLIAASSDIPATAAYLENFNVEDKLQLSKELGEIIIRNPPQEEAEGEKLDTKAIINTCVLLSIIQQWKEKEKKQYISQLKLLFKIYDVKLLKSQFALWSKVIGSKPETSEFKIKQVFDETCASYPKLPSSISLQLAVLAQDKNFSSFYLMLTNNKLIKFCKHGLRGDLLLKFLNTINSLKNLSSDQKKSIFKVILSQPTNEEIKTCIQNTMTLIRCENFDPLGKTKTGEDLKRCVLEQFKSIFSDILPANFEECYAGTFGRFRDPSAITFYASQLKTKAESSLALLKIYVKAVLADNLEQVRCDSRTNPHLRTIFAARPDLQQSWSAGRSFTSPEIFSGRDSKHRAPKWKMYDGSNPCDLLMCGEEVGSCQKFDHPWASILLVGYLLNGQSRLLVVKNEKTGVIIGRAVFRLLWDPEREVPVLLRESIYGHRNNAKVQAALQKMAVIRAKELGIELVAKPLRGDNLAPFHHSLQSLGGLSPSEYIDSLDNYYRSEFTIPPDTMEKVC